VRYFDIPDWVHSVQPSLRDRTDSGVGKCGQSRAERYTFNPLSSLCIPQTCVHDVLNYCSV